MGRFRQEQDCSESRSEPSSQGTNAYNRLSTPRRFRLLRDNAGLVKQSQLFGAQKPLIDCTTSDRDRNQPLRVHPFAFFRTAVGELAFLPRNLYLKNKSARKCRMPLLRVSLVFLLLSAVAFANPKSTTFNASTDDVFKAALKAAAGHRIVIPQDNGLKDLTDSGEEIKSFQFATPFPNITFRVTEQIKVEPQTDGSTKLEVFFYRDRGNAPYVESTSYQVRE